MGRITQFLGAGQVVGALCHLQHTYTSGGQVVDESSDNWSDYDGAETVILSVATATANRGGIYDSAGNGTLTIQKSGLYSVDVEVNYLDYDSATEYSLHLGRKPAAGSFAELTERLETLGGGSRGHQRLRYMDTFAVGDELDIRVANDSTAGTPARLNAFSVTVQEEL